jgi:nitroreductase
MTNLLDLLSHRCSVRSFQDRPVPAEILQEMLEAGRLSPSGGNEQPWTFGVITDPALIAQIAHIAYEQAWITQAPLLIVLCTQITGDERGGREIQIQRYPAYADAIAALDPGLYWALNMEEHQTKIAGTHMSLVALEHGIGSCWVSHFDVQQLAELLQLPDCYLPAEILAFGYADHPRPPRPKMELEKIVFYNYPSKT